MTTFEDSEKESEYGYVRKASGPVVVADDMNEAAMYKLETVGLMINDPVVRAPKPLSMESGPEILGNILGGIQGPLKTIARIPADVYTPRGVSVYATVFKNNLIEHRVALPPDAMGKATYVAPAGQYALKDTMLELELEFQGVKKKVQHASELALLGRTYVTSGAFCCTVISQALPNGHEEPVMKHTTLVANTSKMPVINREASSSRNPIQASFDSNKLTVCASISKQLDQSTSVRNSTDRLKILEFVSVLRRRSLLVKQRRINPQRHQSRMG
ncbi:hypothetical protein KIW84_070468 [Lathyrus oleraceus]|uniref:ATPsynthase alpha/beta subunit barrel-sandwich domain-containing protein n=1 Tax=Pisum sativum TaxID=3888 RepID=A0A9D4VGE2_PEA|nr:hypothetical protein KIW84_070468 [Pisum sativum]